MKEFEGDPIKCIVTASTLDVSQCNIEANNCLNNSVRIAQKYPYCYVVEGILVMKEKSTNYINCVRHAWNYDTTHNNYFDFTIEKDEQKIGISHEDVEYTYLCCCQYCIEEALQEQRDTFKYSYDELLKFIRSKFAIHYFRPRWTCGRYNAEKHVAIMYNLLAGYSFFFESYSADVVGRILSAKRDGEVDINSVAEETGIALESLQPFFGTLYNNGLLIDHLYSDEELKQFRKQLSYNKKSQQSWVDQPTKEKLPVDTSSAEQCYFDAVDNGTTVCSVMFELTYRCSEMCIHCYNPGATRNDKEISHRGDMQELTLDEYKHIIDEMYDLGLVKVCLSGGDPFSNKNAWEIIDYLYQKEIAFDVFTNGQRITKDVKRLANYFPRLVGVSIYSGVAEDHDAITRIKGSWEKSMQVVKELSELAVPMNLKCCVMQPNLHTYYMVADLAKEYGAQPQFEINITESNDGDICAKQLRLTEEQLQVVLRDNNLAYYVGPEAPNYGGQERDLNRSTCGAGRTTFCMAPNGNIRGCTAFTSTYGNLTKSPLKDILLNSENRRCWLSSTLKNFSECGRYEYCGYCNLCAGVNNTEHGDFRKPAETNCYMAKIRHGLAQKLMKKNKDFTRTQFVEALQKLPKAKVTLQRLYSTKG